MLTKCLNCGLQDSQLILDFGSIPIASLLNSVDIFPLEYRKCIKCKFLSMQYLFCLAIYLKLTNIQFLTNVSTYNRI